MKLLSVLLSVAGVSGLIWVCPVNAETPLPLSSPNTESSPPQHPKFGGNQFSKSPRIGGFRGQNLRNTIQETYQKVESPSQFGTTADLLAQGVTRVTGVQVIQTEDRLKLILKTVAGSERLVPLILPEGNDLVIDILDATLAFSIRNGVTKLNPAPGINKVTVIKGDENSIRVRITGTNQTPSAEVVTGREDLVLSITPESTTAEEESDEQIDVIATGQAEDDDYVVDEATTATRTDTPLRDVPQSIQVVPQQVLEDQQVIRLDDALRNVSGVSQNSADPRGQRFQVRGFDASNVLRDGFSLTFGGSFGNSGFQELSNIERVEVLKGPAAILYGTSQPGGIINLVTKKPLSEPYYNFEFSAGNRNLIEPSIDVSGPLTKDGKLLYRLNALYRREDYFRDFDVAVERFFIAPVLQWKISDRTDLFLNFEYLDDQRPNDLGLVAIGDSVADIPFDRNLGERDDTLTAESIRASYRLEHRFNENWTFKNAFNFLTYDTIFQAAEPLELDETTGILSRYFTESDQPSTQYELQTNVTGEFSTGSIEHQLLVGVDLKRRDGSSLDRGNLDNVLDIDIFDPTYGAVSRPNPEDDPLLFDGEFRADRLGVFLQDRIALLDNLKLLAGVRYDAVWQEDTRRPSFFTPVASEDSPFNDAFSPRFGIVYQPIEELSLYSSYSRSFYPNSATTFTGEILPVERGEQFEIGVRSEFLNDRLTSSLALFNLTRQNVATTDPDNPDFSIATGEQRSRGIEIDIAGEILPGWNVIANYAYIDAEITEDNDIPVGNRLFNVPENNFNLWTNYELQTGSLQGLSFGLGFNFIDERFGDLDNSFTVDSYFLTNAAISYERDKWQAAVNFRNLFDVDYIQGTENGRLTEIYPGQGFTVIGTVSAEF